MSAGRKRTINKRPGDPGYQPLQVTLPKVITNALESLGLEEGTITLEGFKGRLIIRLEVIEIEAEITFDPAPDVSEETSNLNGEGDEQN